MVTAEKRAQEAELRSKGYTTELLKTWQPKVDMWRHTPGMNTEGEEVHPIGQLLPGQTTLWDQQVRLSKRGFLPWKPGEDCIKLHNGGCKACRERTVEEVAETLIEEAFPPVEAPATVTEHVHQYKGKMIGSPCSQEGCLATRQTAYKKRKKNG